MRRGQSGAAAVELAACLPLLTVFALLMVQVSAVLLDQLAVTQAAREGARAAAVDPSVGAAAAAAARSTGLDAARLEIRTARTAGQTVQVTATYRSVVRMPMSNRVLLEPVVEGRATMRLEHGA